jgi:hypothetical protein
MEVSMLKRLALRRAGEVEFCDRWATVCDARCRAATLLDQARTRALDFRMGVR